MKLIISSVGPDPSDQVDPRFGRARYFIQFNTDSGAYEPHDNSAQVEAAQGAGVQAAQKVVELGADALLTGHCGPKAFRILSESNIRIYSGFDGSVHDAVQSWLMGKLDPLAVSDGTPSH